MDLSGAAGGDVGPVPEFQAAQNLFDHGAVIDQADDFQQARAARASEWVGFVHFFDKARPRAPSPARELVGAAGILIPGQRHISRLSRRRRESMSPGAAYIGEGAAVAHQLLSGIRDMAAQSGQEVERQNP